MANLLTLCLARNKSFLMGTSNVHTTQTQNLEKVTAADHYILPGHTEQVIDAYVERYELDDKRANDDQYDHRAIRKVSG